MNEEITKYRLDQHEEMIKELQSDVKEIRNDVGEIKHQLSNTTLLLNKIDKTIEENKRKWSSNINTWLVGGVSVIISIVVTYIVNNIINALK